MLTALLLAAINASAYKFMSDGLCYNILSEEDRTVEVTYNLDHTYNDYNDYKHYAGDWSIPATVIYNNTTYSVTSIGDHAFDDCEFLTQVTIPTSVTSIGDYAFYYCKSLTQMKIPNSITNIGKGAFAGCLNLVRFNVAEENQFYTSIEGVLYNKNITVLVACPAVRPQVTIPTSVTSIGAYAFSHCDRIKQVTIPNSVISIGDHAFEYCKRLTLTIPNSVTSIGDYAFSECDSLTQVTVPNSVTFIGDGVFYSCYSLKQVTIPNSVTSIGDYAFCYCFYLTQVTISSTVTSIGDEAFYECNSLTQVTIPGHVTYIGERAFGSCENLTEIYCFPSIPPKAPDYVFDTALDCALYVPTGCMAKYENTDPWSKFWNIQEFDAAGIKDVADGDSDLKIVVRDGNLTVEGGEASAAIEIYSAAGLLLSRSFERSVSGLPKGIYLVRVGNQTSKIAL